MKSRFLPACLLLSCFAPALPAQSSADTPAANAAARPVFGPYEAVVYDRDYLQGVKVDAKGDVFLMFQPGKRDTQLRILNSMTQGTGYRKWNVGTREADDTILVAQENSGRAPDTWTDRIQTSANYIEYRDGTKVFLLLKKIKS